MIIELWQTCNVSIVHRTYFFLLFQGDPADSIYMEVELRRLTFLKQTFYYGNAAMDDGRKVSFSSRLVLVLACFIFDLWLHTMCSHTKSNLR